MSNDLNALRNHLFQTLQAVKDGSIELDQARAINEIGKTLIDSAKVEIDYLRTSQDGTASAFLKPAEEQLPKGILGKRVHRLVG